MAWSKGSSSVRDPDRVFRGHIGEHRDQRGVVPQVVEDDFVIGIEFRMPGVLSIIRIVRQ